MSSSRSEKLLASVQLEKLEADLFRSQALWAPQAGHGTFGGQLVAHSQEAANQTVDTKQLQVHSLHGNFLQAGSSRLPIYYRVVSLRTGKSFATRIVTATQKDVPLYTATISFHRLEKSGLRHSPTMPNVPGPEFGRPDNFLTTSVRIGVEKSYNKHNTNKHMKSSGQSGRRGVRGGEQKETKQGEGSQRGDDADRQAAAKLSFTLRYIQPECLDVANKEGKLSTVVVDEPSRVWMKTGYAGDDQNIHNVVASFISDFSLLYSAFGPHVSKLKGNLKMICSLDHVVYFHAPINVNEWLLYETRSTWAGNNRAVAHGRLYNSKGELAMTTVQEGLIRMKPSFQSDVVVVTSKL